MFGESFKSLENWQRDAVWMRPSPLSSAVTKLYAILDTDQLRADEDGNRRLQITVDGHHDYSTDRTLILAQTSAFGSRHETDALGKILLGAGAALFVAFALFVFAWICQKRRQVKNLKTPLATAMK